MQVKKNAKRQALAPWKSARISGPSAAAYDASQEDRKEAGARALEERPHLGAERGVLAQRAEALPDVSEIREQQSRAQESHVEQGLEVRAVGVADRHNGAGLHGKRPQDRLQS